MKEYNVYFKETLERCEVIKANSEDEAYNIAQDMYDNEDIVLDYNDYVNLEIIPKEKLKGLLVNPNSLPKEIEIQNDLETFQKYVGGYIEVVKLTEDHSVDIICNEEGKINQMPLNRDIGYDIIAGPFVIVGTGDKTGSFTSLTDEQISKYKKRFDEKSIQKTTEEIIKITGSCNYSKMKEDVAKGI